MEKKRIVKCFGILGFAVLFFVFSSSAMAYVVSNTKTGGDCTKIGVWNGKTKTCTLTTDLYADGATIIDPVYNIKVILLINNGGVTLDGNGHSVVGTGQDTESGIRISGSSNVTVKNVTVTGCLSGIGLSGASQRFPAKIIRTSNNTIAGNTISNCIYGIELYSADSNVITGNTITGNTEGIYIHWHSENNIVSGNTIVNNLHQGIDLAGDYLSDIATSVINNYIARNGAEGILLSSNNSTIHGNTLFENQCGVCMYAVHNDSIYNNNFIGTYTVQGYQAQFLIYAPDVNGTSNFSLPMPIGGNYYNYFDTPGEGCSDANADDICDQPYPIPTGTGIDYSPWTSQDGWKK